MLTFGDLKRAILAQEKHLVDSDEVQIISETGERFGVLFVTNICDMYEQYNESNVLLICKERKKLN